MRRSFGYLPALDGLRCMAVSAVVLVHTVPRFAGGRLGVDVFFVISGFLITGLLLQERAASGRIDFGAFYMRRALRLGPALILAILLVAAIVAHTGSNLGGDSLSVVIPSVVFYVGNWVRAAGGSLGYLGHTWSLSIEEQFYLLWPLTLTLVMDRRTLLRWFGLAVVAVVIVRAGLTKVHPDGLEDWTILRLDPLLFGAGLAVLLHRGTQIRWVDSPAVAASASVLLVVLMLIDSTAAAQGHLLMLRGGYTIVAAAATVLVAHVATNAASGVSRLLAWRPVVAVGRVSYGIYLFNFPIFIFVQSKHWPLGVELLVEFGAMIALVYFSWFMVERPALRYKRRFETDRQSVTEPRSPGYSG